MHDDLTSAGMVPMLPQVDALPSAEQQAIFSRGNNVGVLAQKLYPIVAMDLGSSKDTRGD